MQGFIDALAGAGVADPESFVHLNARHEGVEPLARRLLSDDRGITAIVASDSLIALGVFRVREPSAAASRDDLSLVAFDDADWTWVDDPRRSR